MKQLSFLTAFGRMKQPSIFLLVSILTILRNYAVISSPSFYAEDALLFVDGVKKGPSSLLAPMGGHSVLFARIIGYLCTYLPTYWVPSAFAIIASVVFSASVSIIASEKFAWLYPSQIKRNLLALGLSITAGSGEISSSIILSYYYLAIAFGLLVLRESGNREKPEKKFFPLLAALIFSSAITILFLPGLVWLWKKTSSKKCLLVICLCISIFAINTLTGASFERESIYSFAPDLNLARLAQAYFENLSLRLFYYPLFGLPMIHTLTLAPALLMFFLSAVAFLLLLWRMLHLRLAFELNFLTVMFIGEVFLIVPLTCISRKYGYGIFEFPNFCPNLRYSFLTSTAAILYWALESRNTAEREASRAWQKCFFGLALFNSGLIDLIPPQPDLSQVNAEWREFARSKEDWISRRSNLEEYYVPARPLGWTPAGERTFGR